ncbi:MULTISPECIES: hypothetical protein [Flavobacterium]|uniref:Uncharacterized protein n=1 Tax=Flavobacterium keumense TaxID=1306518 RepID=A0ABY8N6N4_9FLAO|nr:MULTISPECIES: hypothetical protein [Flavobacterium]WGK94286.1 hypothetical protein MG292_09390 [Flavobacterium keumense]
MKKILLLIALLFSVLTFAQNQGITYQAVLYNSKAESLPGINNSSSPMTNKLVCLQFSIIDSNLQTEYQEKATVTTDAFGMVNLVIGYGTQTGGYASSFSTIVWSNGQKKLKVSLDQTGNCTVFEEISNQLLTYVPYALNASNAASVSGVVGIANGGTNATTILGAKTNLQLQNVDNTSDLNKPISTATQVALETKVDKISGKGLSTEDFTTAEKTKLASLTGTPDLSGYATVTSLTDAVTNKFVDLTTNQAIAGNKNFTSDIQVNGLTIGKGKGQNDQNTAVGAGALNSSNSNGTRNTAVGALALANYAGTTFDNNTGVGYFNMIGLTTGYGNTSLGAETMFNVGAASNNTAIGNQSLINTAGDNNVGVGARSGDGLTTGTNNTFLGTQARTLGSSSTISNSTALGYDAVVSTNNTIQLGNAAITDVKTNGAITATKFKIPNGTASQFLMADGSVSNSAGVPYNGATTSVNLGNNNLQANQITTNSLSVGNINNLAVGMKGTGETNYFGNGSMAYSPGGFANTAFGTLTLSETQGDENTALGSQAMRSNTTGAKNTAVGRASLGGNLTGSSNTAIGYNTRVGSNNLTNTTVIGANAIVSASNTIQLGDTNITSVKTSGKLTTGSITLPNTDGTSGQVLSTNGSGVVSWITPSSVNTSNLVDLTTNQTVAGNKTLSGITTVSNTTASTTTTSGAFVVAGGAGIAGNVNVGGNETISGSLGIGTTATNSSAALEVNSTTKGILFPRVTLAQRDLIASPAKGLVIMCTDCGQTGGELGELQVFNGSRWTNAVGTDASGVSAGINAPAIGSSFQGGLVAYILAPTDPGYEAGKIKGLIVTATDISSAAGIRYDAGTAILGINNVGTAIGTGLANTVASYTAYGSVNRSIPKIAMDYSVVENGVTYDDWYIPSRDELLKIHANKALLGSFPSSRGYWSSSLWTNSQALTMVVFSDTRGYYGGDGTDDGRNRVRFVRSFSIPIQTTITATNFNGNATSATNVSGVVAIANGGTGATTATGAINALLPSQASANGKVLTSDGTNVSWTSPGGNTHYVGESYGGGIVFYTYDNGAHGLIVATSEIGDLGPESSTSTTGITFGGNGIWTGAYRYGVGGGLENTSVIISKNSNSNTQYFNYSRTTNTLYAALSASQYLPGGTQSMYYGDWYLPSKGELELLWNNRLLISGSGYNPAHEYWSSTETNEFYAYKMQTNGGVGWTPKTALCFVLPIRRF